MKAKAIFPLVLCALTACVSTKAPEKSSPASTQHSDTAPRTSVEAKEVAAEEDAAYVVEISFSKGSAVLNKAAKENLAKFLKQTNAAGKIDELKIITWADSEYPSPGTKKLSKDDQKLVEARTKSLTDYFKAVKATDKVSTYDMTTRPNLFSDWLSTADAKIKNSLEAAGVPNTDSSVKTPSKAGKAIVMSILEHKE